MPTHLDYALDYASRGWAVFPVHTPTPNGCSCGRNCPIKHRGKHPRTAHGHNDATTDPVTIRKWWSQWPDANIGIATGAVSNLTVWDFDTYKPDATLPEQLGDWPETLEVATGGGGRQFYFQHAQTAAKGVNAFEAVDIKSDGGYVVAPPSLHQSGRRYEWTNEADVAEMPAWLICLEGKPRSRQCRRNEPGERVKNYDARSTSSSCAVTPSGAPGSFRGYAIDRELARFLELPVEFSGNSSPAFWCPLHEDGDRPSAWLRRTESGDILFNCTHEGGWSLTLPQLYASLLTGTIATFKEDGKSEATTHVVWRLRLVFDAGLMEVRPRKHHKLPADVPPSVTPVWNGYILLLGLKDHLPQWRGNPAAFSWRFIVAWCGVTYAEARYAMKWLLEHGYLEGTKLDKKVYGRAMEVFQPSTKPYTIVPLRELRHVCTPESILEECYADDEDREPAAVPVVSGAVGMAGEDGTEDERDVFAERHPRTAVGRRLQQPAANSHARVRVRQVRRQVRGEVREEVCPRLPQPEVEAAVKAEVEEFWRTRVRTPTDVDSRAGDVDRC
jgi:hypothetical protein